MYRRVDYEEMDVEDVLTLMNNKVDEINWRKTSQKQLSKIHKLEAKIMCDIETALMKLSGHVEQRRAKMLKEAKPYYLAYGSVLQYVDDRKREISGLLSDVKTMKTNAEQKEKILRESAKAMDTGKITAKDVVGRKVKYVICQTEALNNKEEVGNKQLKLKKQRNGKYKPKPDVDMLKQKYIECHEEAEISFNATLRSAEVSLDAAKRAQSITATQETQASPIRTAPIGIVNHNSCSGVSDLEGVNHVASVPTTSGNMSACSRKDLLSISESDIDLLEAIDLRAQGDSTLYHPKVISRTTVNDGVFAEGENHLVPILYTDLPGAISISS